MAVLAGVLAGVPALVQVRVQVAPRAPPRPVPRQQQLLRQRVGFEQRRLLLQTSQVLVPSYSSPTTIDLFDGHVLCCVDLSPVFV